MGEWQKCRLDGQLHRLSHRRIAHAHRGPGRGDRRGSGASAQPWLNLSDWPVLPTGQAMHTAEVHPLGLRQRTPFMELPSGYLAEITGRQAGLTC